MQTRFPCLCLASLLLLSLFPFSADAEIKPIQGPAKAEIGDIAQMDIAAGYGFIPQDQCKEFMDLTQNFYSGTELGVLLKPGDTGWYWLFFEFDDIGFIKDAASEKLDAKEMWESLLEGQEEGNKARQEKGWPIMEILAWAREPFYNPETQRLEWGTRLRSEGKEFVNYHSRILGRKGIMRVTLVCNPGELAEVLVDSTEALKKFEFKAGNRYAEWTQGDKVAAIGLAGLVVGAAGVKMGLFAKFWKWIVALFIAGKKLLVVALIAVAAFFKKLFGKKPAQPQ